MSHDDDPTPVRVNVEVQSSFFESSQGEVVLVDDAGLGAREAAAELIAKLSRQVAESLGETLPMDDVMLLADALADRIGATPEPEEFADVVAYLESLKETPKK